MTHSSAIHTDAAASAAADADTEDEISLLDLLQVVMENLRLLVLGPLLVGVLALAASFMMRPVFSATTQILPPQLHQSGAAAMLQSLGSLGGIASATAGLKNPTDQYVALLKSRSVQDALIQRFGLQQRYGQKFLQGTRKQLDGNTVISSGKDGLIAIETSDHEPAFAADLANAYVQELRTLLSRLALTEAQQRRVFFEAQLKQTREKLVEAEKSLNASGLNGSALKTSPQAAMEGVARLKASITAQEIKLASMRNYLAETAPDFRQAQSELAAMRAQMAQADRSERTTAGDSDYIRRYRDYKYFETLLELFAKQYEIARVDESREGAVIQVVDVALPPEWKRKPQRGMIAIIATLAAGFALLVFAMLRHAIANASRNPLHQEKLSRLNVAWHRALGMRQS